MNTVLMARSCENTSRSNEARSPCWTESQGSSEHLKRCLSTLNGSLWERDTQWSVTYPTPPYMALRQSFRKEIHLVMRRRQLMDMKKTLHLRDRLLFEVTETSVRVIAQSVFRYYNTKRARVTDKENKQLRKEGSKLIAELKMGSNNGATFEIHNYSASQIIPGKTPVVMDIMGENPPKYLSCDSQHNLILEGKPDNLPQNISDSQRRFIFWKADIANMVSFESELHRGYYICTNPDSQSGPVQLMQNPQQAISEFKVFNEGSFSVRENDTEQFVLSYNNFNKNTPFSYH